MTKQLVMAFVAIFVAWMLIDFVSHGFLLRSLYEATPGLWRPAAEMNVPLIYLVATALILLFVAIYKVFVRPKSLAVGFGFGVLYGLAIGISVGFGPWLHMPLPLALAWGWFFGGSLKAVVAGAIVGYLVND
jgi:hypothetical protein